MIKISWGKKILFLYLGFVVLIISMVVLSFRKEVNLVEKDYYAQEMALDSKKIAMQNYAELKQEIRMEQIADSVYVFLPDTLVSYKNLIVHFFRPSSSKLDIIDSIGNTNTQKFSYPLSSFVGGKYLLISKWGNEAKQYENEQIIFINK